MVNAQEWLDKNYPKEGTCIRKEGDKNNKNHEDFGKNRSEITDLDISVKNLTGSLKLEGFNDLTTLDCSSNQLTNFNYSALNPQTLTYLDIKSNNLVEQDLTVFSQFTNLKWLWIGNWDEDKINQNIYNRWIGSLEPLKNLTKLKGLDISNTDLNQGVEYLPSRIKYLYYDINKQPNCKLQAITWQLGLFKSGNYQNWAELEFTFETIKPWLEVGLANNEYNFANYLKQKGNDPNQGSFPAQDWVEGKYSSTERPTITEIDISKRKLIGNLDLSEFTNLWKLDCSHNQITNLNLSNSLKLKELIVNDNQLTDILLPTDSEQLILERVDIANNEHLNYALIENRFTKPLPILTENKIRKIEETDFKQMIKDRVSIKGTIKDIHYFSPWWNPNCALVINKVVWYAVRLVVCEPLSEVEENRKIELESELKITHEELAIKKNESVVLQENLEKLKKKNKEYKINNKHLVDELEESKKELNKLENNKKEEKNEENEKSWEEKINEAREKIQENQIEKNIEELQTKEDELASLDKEINGDQQRIEKLEVAINKIITNRVFKVFKISEHIYKGKTYKDIEELKTQLNSDNPILALYPNNSGFSPSEVMEITKLPQEAKQNPDEYLKPTDLVWRNMDKLPSIMPDCYHVAVYLGDSRVVHIGSSKFVKVSKVKDSKSLLGTRNDHWLDFLHGTKDNLYRYHPIIPFQRPEKIQEHLTKAILAEYGVLNYSFLGNNCEHFATLCVCGIPFSTQADKIKMLTNRVYLDLVKEMQNSEQEFAKISSSETYQREFRRNELAETITNLRNKTEPTEEEQEQLTSLETELKELQTSREDLLQAQFIWEQRIKDETNKKLILGIIIKVIPLENNQALVINKVALYAVRLLEYKDNKLTELKRFAKNKLGYATLADAEDKVKRFITNQENDTESLQTISQISFNSEQDLITNIEQPLK